MSGCGCERSCGTPKRKRVVVPVVAFNQSAEESSADVVLWLKNPSVQLSCLVAIVMQVELSDNNTLEWADSAAWQITPALPPEQPLIQPSLLRPVFVNALGVPTPRALPDGYTLADPTKLAQISATIAGSMEGESAAAGTVYAIATWEPFDPNMPQALWDELAQSAGLSLDGGTRQLFAT